MAVDKIRSDYQALDEIARGFGSQADSTRQMLQQIKQSMDALKGGDWVGKGADKFYAEMDSALLPAVQRLLGAFEAARQTTQKISQVMKQAENDAAALFKAAASGVAAGGSGVAGGSSGGSGGSGAGGSSGGSG